MKEAPDKPVVSSVAVRCVSWQIGTALRRLRFAAAQLEALPPPFKRIGTMKNFPIILILVLASGCVRRGNIVTPLGTVNAGSGSRTTIESTGKEIIEVKIRPQE